MQNTNTRRGFTQEISYTGETNENTSRLHGKKNVPLSPLPAFGHPLPQGERKTNGGFTLIELLVVVLIIGILAAVSVPQYRKVVEKARASEALVSLKNAADAANFYYLNTGAYTDMSLDKLDIRPAEVHYYVYVGGGYIYEPNHMDVVVKEKSNKYSVASVLVDGKK